MFTCVHSICPPSYQEDSEDSQNLTKFKITLEIDWRYTHDGPCAVVCVPILLESHSERRMRVDKNPTSKRSPVVPGEFWGMYTASFQSRNRTTPNTASFEERFDRHMSRTGTKTLLIHTWRDMPPWYGTWLIHMLHISCLCDIAHIFCRTHHIGNEPFTVSREMTHAEVVSND